MGVISRAEAIQLAIDMKLGTPENIVLAAVKAGTITLDEAVEMGWITEGQKTSLSLHLKEEKETSKSTDA
ncbi:MAG: hypothetical protein K6C34_03520 [Alphaproteobacteria bacterium]|nr:hypothetical protein [Alphaproteobacteria bacterium]